MIERVLPSERITVILYEDLPTIINELCPDATLIYVKNKNDFLCSIQRTKDTTDIYVNLYDCDDALFHFIVEYFDKHNIPYTGADPSWCNPTREIMKQISTYSGVKSPKAAFVYSTTELEQFLSDGYKGLTFPMFVKSFSGGDSKGIDENSKVCDEESLIKQVNKVLEGYGGVLIEEFIDGREFSVLVSGSPYDNSIKVYEPVEFDVNKSSFTSTKDGRNFLTEHSKSYSDNINDYWYEPCEDPIIAKELKEIAFKLFLTKEVTGYYRYDIRYDIKTKEYYVLDMNPYCSLFSSFIRTAYSTADSIIHYSGMVFADFLEELIKLGIARGKRNEDNTIIKYIDENRLYGMFAKKSLQKDEKIYCDEMKGLRVVSREFLLSSSLHSSLKDNYLNKYSWQLNHNLFVYYHENPEKWKPINHSCNPNSFYSNLTVYAKRSIQKDEEITLDYLTFIVDNNERENESFVVNHQEERSNSEGSVINDDDVFHCQCGATNCRGKSDLYYSRSLKKDYLYSLLNDNRNQPTDHIAALEREKQLLRIVNHSMGRKRTMEECDTVVSSFIELSLLKNGEIVLKSKKDILKGTMIFDFHSEEGKSLLKETNTERHPKSAYFIITKDSCCFYDLKQHFLQFLKPSCHPNVIVDQEIHYLQAACDISVGDVLSFDYCQSESFIPITFSCSCQRDDCRGSIGGFKSLNDETKELFKNSGLVTSHLQSIMNK
jgi:D-alanine-D-alanine ligase-like ATP-grasp enzyme